MNPVLYARVAGLAYLAIFVLAIGANFGVLDGLLVRGDAEATLANIITQETRFRLAIAALFVVLCADLVVAWAFYVLFKPLAPTPLSRASRKSLCLPPSPKRPLSAVFSFGVPRRAGAPPINTFFTKETWDGQAT